MSSANWNYFPAYLDENSSNSFEVISTRYPVPKTKFFGNLTNYSLNSDLNDNDSFRLPAFQYPDTISIWSIPYEGHGSDFVATHQATNISQPPSASLRWLRSCRMMQVAELTASWLMGTRWSSS